MKTTAHIVSFIFHPLFILVYILGLLYWINPYIFNEQNKKEEIIFVTYTLVSVLVIPVVSIVLMKNLNIIKSFSMEDKMERVGPMIVVSIVYLWLFINFKNNTVLPMVFAAVMLGSCISVLVSFFINNFTKISLHSVGMGSFVASLFILKFKLQYANMILKVSEGIHFEINLYLLILISIVIAGLVGSVRLYLKAHTREQVYSGYLLGILSQLIAFSVIL
jgi:membrane-associated phospholipid phosphatase